jgi:hypothetical protein
VAVVSGLTVPALYFGGDAILSLLRAPGLEPYLILVPVFVFISGVFLALNYWNSRTKHFGRLSVARITSSLAAALGTGDLPDRRGEVEHRYLAGPRKDVPGQHRVAKTANLVNRRCRIDRERRRIPVHLQ